MLRHVVSQKLNEVSEVLTAAITRAMMMAAIYIFETGR
jgi:hypothetical protein